MAGVKVADLVKFKRGKDQQRKPEPCACPECEKPVLPVGAATSAIATYPSGQAEEVWLCADCVEKYLV